MSYQDGTKKEKQRLKNIYYGLNARCNNPNSTSYKNYGGRGIKNEWKSKAEFIADMFDAYVIAFAKYGNTTQIDRIDNNGNYCKDNCRWVDPKTNANNKSNNLPTEEKLRIKQEKQESFLYGCKAYGNFWQKKY